MGITGETHVGLLRVFPSPGRWIGSPDAEPEPHHAAANAHAAAAKKSLPSADGVGAENGTDSNASNALSSNSTSVHCRASANA
jgi:hypothetical protein